MTGTSDYRVLRPPRHEIQRVRGLDVHLTRWGPPSATSPVFLLHGWQDTGDTFQFMVDAFLDDWPLVALDWRGFGRSEWCKNGYYTFPDYVADLDALLDMFSAEAPARLVGHSMGGNIASLYAGVRPERVRCLANLEGFGLPRTTPDRAPIVLRKWLDQAKGAPVSKDYDSFEQLASIVGFRYPRFSSVQANYVAQRWARLEADGRVHLLGDPRHRWINPLPYTREDSEAIWRGVTAPVLCAYGSESEYLGKLGADGAETALRTSFPGVEMARVPGAGHMLHIDQPALVAGLVEEFLRSHR